MGIIHLKNIRVYAHHGCLSQETIIGSDYIVNLKVKANLSTSCQTDELTDTVDYVSLNTIVVKEMAVASKLLENVAMRIINSILDELKNVTWVRVEVEKVNPPIGGDVLGVSVVLEKSR